MQTKDYLSKEYTQSLKGIFAIAVLLHHLYQYSGLLWNTVPGQIMQCMGYLSVAMFFFYTGYGLIISSQRETYLTTFIKARVIPLYVFYIFLIIIYGGYQYVLGIFFTTSSLLQSFLFGKTIVPLAWYLQVTIVMYLFYWLVFVIFKMEKLRQISMLVITISFCIICYACGLGSTWFESILCINLGMLWAYKKEQVDDLLDRKNILISILSFVLFGILLVASIKIGVISKMLSAVAFSIFFTSFSHIVSGTHLLNNKITQWLGKYSLEIYVSQGFFLLLRKGGRINIDNPCIFVCVVILGTILIALVIHPVYNKIVTGCRKIFKV